MKRSFPLKHTVCSADINTYRQDVLLANRLVWNPRPLFQGFAAYSPGLQALDVAHLMGSNSPQQIYFRPETIDACYPALDDGSSWPVIRSRHEIVDIEREHAHLSHREHPDALPMQDVTTSEINIGEDFPLEPPKPSLFAQIDFHMMPAGRLLPLLYELPELYISVATAPSSDRSPAEVHEICLIPGEAASGFLLSALAISTSDFLA